MSGNGDLHYIEKMKKGDRKALYVIYDRYSAAIYGVIIRICRNEPKAEDLLQEVFMKIWENISTFDPNKGKFYTWANRIARNTTLNSLRKKDPFIQTDDFSVYESTTQPPETENNFEALKGALTTLKEHHQRAIELVYYQGYTHREAHEVMGVPLGTFKSYVKQALVALKSAYPARDDWNL